MKASPLLRLLSHVVPIRLERAEGRHGHLELTLERGRLVVNSAQANQSFGSLHRVWQQALDHFMPTDGAVRAVLLLGLGTGSAVHILRKERGLSAPITALEDDPLMLDWGRRHFGIDDWADLRIVEGDARRSVKTLEGTFDLVLVDLFEDLSPPGWAADPDFQDALRARTSTGGTLIFNTIVHNEATRGLSGRIGSELRLRFGQVDEQGYEGLNRLFIAR